MGFVRLSLLALVLLVLGPSPADGDGGAVVARGAGDGLSVTVFAAPVPLRAGPVDLSVLVQRVTDARPVLDAEVWVDLRSPAGRVVRRRADHDRATNKLLYAATLALPGPGVWRLLVEVAHGSARSTVETTVHAAEPVPPVARFWPWLVLPPTVVALFVLHQWLRDRGALSPGAGASRRRRR